MRLFGQPSVQRGMALKEVKVGGLTTPLDLCREAREAGEEESM